jgi:hypothetical protein
MAPSFLAQDDTSSKLNDRVKYFDMEQILGVSLSTNLEPCWILAVLKKEGESKSEES